MVNGSVDLGAYEFQDDLPEGTVYRLFDPEVGIHFYTSSKEERNSVIADLPQYEYEGAAYSLLITYGSHWEALASTLDAQHKQYPLGHCFNQPLRNGFGMKCFL